jgi:hypothetical protein
VPTAARDSLPVCLDWALQRLLVLRDLARFHLYFLLLALLRQTLGEWQVHWAKLPPLLVPLVLLVLVPQALVSLQSVRVSGALEMRRWRGLNR